MIDDGAPAPTVVGATTIEGGPIGEVQRVGYSMMDTPSGTFTLTAGGQTTGNIAYNASAATVQSALEALSNIDPGEVIHRLPQERHCGLKVPLRMCQHCRRQQHRSTCP